MRIVIATPLYPPEIGGPATYAEILNTELPKRGIEVTLVKFSDVRHLPKLVRHFAYYKRMREAAKTADLILALDPVSVGLPAMKAAQKLKKKYIVRVAGDYAWEQGRQRFGITENLDDFVTKPHVPLAVRVLRRIQARVAKSAVRVIAPSEYLKNIVTAWGIAPEHIEVIYNAVPIGELGTVPEAVQKLPKPLVVTAGRLVPWKHVDALISAIGSTTGISLAIVGDGPLRSALEDQAQHLGDRVVFTGLLSHPDTLATIKSADVFILNSSYEGFSHLLIEALSLGVPSIATEVGGNTEIMTHEESGLLVKAGDAHALATALSRAIGEEELRRVLKVKAKESAERFTTGVMLDKTVSLLKAV